MIVAFRTLALVGFLACLSRPLPAAGFAVSSGSNSVLCRIDLETKTVASVGSTI
jgi:hypothetical protein